MRYYVTIEERVLEVDLSGEKPRVDGVEVDAELVRLPHSDLYHLRTDGAGHTFELRRGDSRGAWEILAGGKVLEAGVVDVDGRQPVPLTLEALARWK